MTATYVYLGIACILIVAVTILLFYRMFKFGYNIGYVQGFSDSRYGTSDQCFEEIDIECESGICMQCGEELQLVRLGKCQCPNCGQIRRNNMKTKRSWTCPNCGTTNPNTTTECSGCGYNGI